MMMKTTAGARGLATLLGLVASLVTCAGGGAVATLDPELLRSPTAPLLILVAGTLVFFPVRFFLARMWSPLGRCGVCEGPVARGNPQCRRCGAALTW